MKLYARLEKKYSENDHVIDEVVRYYTEQEVLNEYWLYWIGRTDSFLTKDNCITDWLKTYQGWVDVSDDDDTFAKSIEPPVEKVNYTIKEITLKELYDNLAASLFDIIREGVIEPVDSYYFNVLSFIAHGNIEGIRKAFVDGDSAILVPDILECIEEVRIYDNDKLLMVVVGDEIQY